MSKAREALCKTSVKFAAKLRAEGTLMRWASEGKFPRKVARGLCINYLNREYHKSGPRTVEVCMQYVESAYRFELLNLIKGSKI